MQVKLIKMGGRLVRHSRRLNFQLSEVSVPRWLFQGVLDRIGPVIAGAKLREGKTTILPRGRALQGVGLSSMRFHPIGGGPEDDKDGQEGCSTTANASLYGHSLTSVARTYRIVSKVPSIVGAYRSPSSRRALFGYKLNRLSTQSKRHPLQRCHRHAAFLDVADDLLHIVR